MYTFTFLYRKSFTVLILLFSFSIGTLCLLIFPTRLKPFGKLIMSHGCKKNKFKLNFSILRWESRYFWSNWLYYCIYLKSTFVINCKANLKAKTKTTAIPWFSSLWSVYWTNTNPIFRTPKKFFPKSDQKSKLKLEVNVENFKIKKMKLQYNCYENKNWNVINC